MATIENVTLCNINIEDGDKLIPYNTFHFRSLLSLFLLENGGGKTTFIHLLLQVILPNTPNNKRTLQDTLQKGKHGHIIVEWKLDQAGTQRLITGFSFENRKELHSDQSALRYYTYLIEYPKNQFSIKELPLYLEQDGRKYVTSYEEYRQKLKEIRKVLVQVFRSNETRKYQDDLRSHGIIPDEWESIKKINVSEGAADKFFEKTDTVTTLLERLFIPTIEDSLFPKHKNKSVLAESFQKFQDNLLRIPDIQKNIQDFMKVEEYIENVIKAVEKHEEFTKKTNSFKEHLLQLAETIHLKIEGIKQQVLSNYHRKETLKNVILDYQWKKDSFEVYKIEKKLKQSREEIQSEKRKFHELEYESESKDETVRQLESLRLYEKLIDAEKRIAYFQELLESMTKKNEELIEEVYIKFKEASNAWNEAKIEKENHLNALNNTLERKKEERKKAVEHQETLAPIQNELFKSIERYNLWVETFNQKRNVLLQWFEEWDLLDPNQCLQRVKRELEQHEDDYVGTEENIRQLDIDIELINDKEKICMKENFEITTKFKEVTGSLDDYEKDFGTLESMLSAFGKRIPTSQFEADELIVFLNNQIGEKNEDIEKMKDKIKINNKQIERLADKSYFVPHDELDQVKSYLESQIIYVVLGSEWLSEQNLTDDQKIELLEQHPLLPYTLLIEEAQIKHIEKTLDKRQWQLESPVIFMLKDALISGNRERAANRKLIYSHEYTWVYQGLDVNLFVSPSKIKQWLQSLEEEVREYRTKLINLTNRRDQYTQTYEKCTGFLRHYPLGWYDTTLEQHASLEEKLNDKEREMKGLEATREKNKKQQELLKTELRKFKDKIDESKEKYKITKEFAELSNEENTKRSTNQQNQKKFNDIKDELTGLTKFIKNLTNEINDVLTPAIADKDAQYRLFVNEQQQYKWKPDGTQSSVEYEIAKETYQAAKDALDKEHRTRQEYIDTIGRENDNVELFNGQINEKRISVDWLKENKRIVLEHEISEAKLSRQAALKYKRNQEEKVNALDKALGKIEGRHETLIEKIKENHSNKDPYTYENELEYKEVLHDLQKSEEEDKNIDSTLKRLEENKKNYDDAYRHISFVMEIQNGIVNPLDHQIWEDDMIVIFTKTKIKEFNQSKDLLSEQENRVVEEFEVFKHTLHKTNNYKLKQLSRQFDILLAEKRLFDSNYVITRFAQMLEALDKYKQFEGNLKLQVDKDRNDLVGMCYKRVESIYERIIEIPKSSKMKLYGRDIQAIQLRWDKQAEEKAKQNLNNHIFTVIEDVKEQKMAGVEDDQIRKFIEQQLDAKELMKHYASFYDCRIKVFKPKKEHILQNSKVKYDDWEVAVKWSGGERYTVYMIMFMVYIMHIRQTITGREKESFTIIADNPFGAASNNHVVDPVLEIANKNNIQLICLTAHDTENIIRKFPVVYSNVYRYKFGKEIMDTKQIQTLESLQYVDESEGEQEQLNLLT
jgi:hypothetical protein